MKVLGRDLLTAFAARMKSTRNGCVNMANEIHNETAYRAAMAEIDALMALQPAPGSAEGSRLFALATLVEAYEKRVYPFPEPTVDELAAFIEQERDSYRGPL
ncbi:hypothetical protein ACLB1G_25225 [Oxalobacteraceae bacterium A2-2]